LEVDASFAMRRPITVGSPRDGFCGNDEIHLRIAIPLPSAGIARKSPYGGESR
jgi:hypothetical protein